MTNFSRVGCLGWRRRRREEGGGYSGVELALNLVDRFAGSERRVEVNLVHRTGKGVLEHAADFKRRAGTERLERAGINVLTGTSVEEVLPVREDGGGGVIHSTGIAPHSASPPRVTTARTGHDPPPLDRRGHPRRRPEPGDTELY